MTSGLHVVYVPLDGPVDGLNLTLADATATLCVTDVDVGVPSGGDAVSRPGGSRGGGRR